MRAGAKRHDPEGQFGPKSATQGGRNDPHQGPSQNLQQADRPWVNRGVGAASQAQPLALLRLPGRCDVAVPVLGLPDARCGRHELSLWATGWPATSVRVQITWIVLGCPAGKWLSLRRLQVVILALKGQHCKNRFAPWDVLRHCRIRASGLSPRRSQSVIDFVIDQASFGLRSLDGDSVSQR